MELILAEESAQVARITADILGAQLARQPDSVLGLPTGDTPLALYRELVRRHRHGRIDLGRAITFNLDEYLGLDQKHPGSYACYMRQWLFEPIGMDPGRTHVPNGAAADPEHEARSYEERIHSAGGIDMQLLGIGVNGHIGFNEPGSALDSRTRVVRLSGTTLAANRRHFPHGETLPTHAITMGAGTILEARRIVLLATGRSKAPAVRAALSGPVTTAVPASVLQQHPDTVIILDPAAAGELDESLRRRVRQPETQPP